MSKSEKNVKEISKEEMANVTGGYVVEVDPNDIDKEKLGLKRYLVVNDQNGKILNSFDKCEDAFAADAVANWDKDWTLKMPQGELHKHISKSADDGSLIFKEW